MTPQLSRKRWCVVVCPFWIASSKGDSWTQAAGSPKKVRAAPYCMLYSLGPTKTGISWHSAPLPLRWREAHSGSPRELSPTAPMTLPPHPSSYCRRRIPRPPHQSPTYTPTNDYQTKPLNHEARSSPFPLWGAHLDNPYGASLPLHGPSPTGGPKVHPYWGGSCNPCHPPLGPLSRTRPFRGLGISGVSAVGGWCLSHAHNPTG